MRAKWKLGCLAMLAVPAQAQESAHAGSAACGVCHPQQYESQSASGHARTLVQADAHPFAEEFLPRQPLRQEPRYRFVYSLDESGFNVAIDDGEYLLDLPLEWAFGAGAQGVTFVSQSDERNYVEHAFSYYAKANGLAITTGHESVRPETLHQAAGRPYRATADEIGRCFACHSTGGISFGRTGGVSVRELGVRCETCHGPGGDHIAPLSAGDRLTARLAIDNPKRRSPAELNEFCGDCHRRPKSPSANFDFREAWNVRHQPPYLARSRCFLDSGNLSCLSCHNPHEDVRPEDAAYYRSKCVDCHIGGTLEPASACGAVERVDCVECHMPEVEVGDHLALRNHWIGVYAESDKTVPSR